MRLNDLIAKGLPKRRCDRAAAPVPVLETVGPLTKQRARAAGGAGDIRTGSPIPANCPLKCRGNFAPIAGNWLPEKISRDSCAFKDAHPRPAILWFRPSVIARMAQIKLGRLRQRSSSKRALGRATAAHRDEQFASSFNCSSCNWQKQFVGFDRSRGEALLVDILADRCECRAIGLESIGPEIVTELPPSLFKMIDQPRQH